MKSFKEFISEEIGHVSDKDIKALEKVLDQLYAMINVDVEFGRHFMDRVNDARNIKPITVPELSDIFTKAFNKYGAVFRDSDKDWQAVLTDLKTDINVPFMIQWNKSKRELELIGKTVMRNKNYMTRDKKWKV